MIDYKKIPDWWAVCPNSDCPLAETCLRQQACRVIPQHVKCWTSILPQAQGDNECKHFLMYEKVTMAQGLNNIYNNVRAREARSKIRVTLTDYLGSKGTYYRYKDGERLINPKLQQEIINIVHRYAPGVEVTFDKSHADYDFTTNKLEL